MKIVQHKLYLVTQFIIAVCVVLTPFAGQAQEVYNEYQGTYRGEVLSVVEQQLREVPGTDTETLLQTISVQVLDGPKEGQTLTIENEYLELEQGDKFYFNHNIYIDGTESYFVVNIDRRDSLILFFGLFIFTIVVFGGVARGALARCTWG